MKLRSDQYLNLLIKTHHELSCKRDEHDACSVSDSEERIFELFRKCCHKWLPLLFQQSVQLEKLRLRCILQVCEYSESLHAVGIFLRQQMKLEDQQDSTDPKPRTLGSKVQTPRIESSTPMEVEPVRNAKVFKANKKRKNVSKDKKRVGRTPLTQQMVSEIKSWLSIIKLPYPHICNQVDCMRCIHLMKNRRLTTCKAYHKGACNPLGLYPHITKAQHDLKRTTQYKGFNWENPLSRSANQNSRQIHFVNSSDVNESAEVAVREQTVHSKVVAADNRMLEDMDAKAKVNRHSIYHMREGQPHLASVFEMAKRHVSRIKSKYGEKAEFPSFATCMYKVLYASETPDEMTLNECIRQAQAMGSKPEKERSRPKRKSAKTLTPKQSLKRLTRKLDAIRSAKQ